MLHPTDKKLGFTIVEILVVIAVIGILLSISTVYFYGVRERAYATDRLNEITNFKNAIELYANQERMYPAVPRPGDYCLGVGLASSANVQSLGGPTGLPTTLAGAPANYCHEIKNSTKLNASYPGLNNAIASISNVSSTASTRPLNERLTKDKQYLGPYVRYTDPDATLTKAKLSVLMIIDQPSCPRGTREDASYSATQKVCAIDFVKTLPTTYTGEAWNYAGS